MKVYICSERGKNKRVFADKDNARNWMIEKLINDPNSAYDGERSLKSYSFDELAEAACYRDYRVDEFIIGDYRYVNAPTHIMQQI